MCSFMQKIMLIPLKNPSGYVILYCKQQGFALSNH